MLGMPPLTFQEEGAEHPPDFMCEASAIAGRALDALGAVRCRGEQ